MTNGYIFAISNEQYCSLFINHYSLRKFLCNDKKEFVLSKQVLRSGTSIGANVEEADGGISMSDFSNKISLAYFQ